MPDSGAWRLLSLGETDPYRNMALEEVLLEAVEEAAPNTLRLWRNTRSVVIGWSQRPEEVLNLENCRCFGVSVVRRFTGGGAVYQDLGNLNWTFACRRDVPPLRRGMTARQVFKRLSSPILEALRELGLEAEFNPPNAIYLEGGKISGMAMYIKRRSLLCHGTLLVDSDLNLLRLTLRRLKDPVTNLREEIPSLTMEEVMNSIIRASEDQLSIKLIKGGLSTLEEELLERHPPQRYDALRGRESYKKGG
ncbi:lipoate--protein ligase family protein [Candidatus Bathyarchaeota archaeon]|nr:lipoate--protein ligase family protein [Candidatus Bathyarchaeota archaeon]